VNNDGFLRIARAVYVQYRTSGFFGRSEELEVQRSWHTWLGSLDFDDVPGNVTEALDGLAYRKKLIEGRGGDG
jgi:hypothetical protein